MFSSFSWFLSFAISWLQLRIVNSFASTLETPASINKLYFLPSPPTQSISHFLVQIARSTTYAPGHNSVTGTLIISRIPRPNFWFRTTPEYRSQWLLLFLIELMTHDQRGSGRIKLKTMFHGFSSLVHVDVLLFFGVEWLCY